MLAFKCDRCGECQSLEKIHKIVINAHTTTPQNFDLCQRCNKELIQWLTKNQDFEKGTT